MIVVDESPDSVSDDDFYQYLSLPSSSSSSSSRGFFTPRREAAEVDFFETRFVGGDILLRFQTKITQPKKRPYDACSTQQLGTKVRAFPTQNCTHILHVLHCCGHVDGISVDVVPHHCRRCRDDVNYSNIMLSTHMDRLRKSWLCGGRVFGGGDGGKHRHDDPNQRQKQLQ